MIPVGKKVIIDVVPKILKLWKFTYEVLLPLRKALSHPEYKL